MYPTFNNSKLQNTFSDDESLYSDTLSSYSSSEKTSTKKSGKWSQKEDDILQHYVTIYGQKDWKKVSRHLPGRAPLQCLQRYNKILKPENIKGPWSAEEDNKLVAWVEAEGPKKWAQASAVITGRTGKQIRERWFNHLNPDVKRGSWSEEEDEQIFELYQKYGTSWSKFTKYMLGRPENSIKNRFYSTLRKLVSDKRKHKNGDIVTSEEESENFELSQQPVTHLYKVLQNQVVLPANNKQYTDYQTIKVGSDNVIILQKSAETTQTQTPSTTKTSTIEDQFINYSENHKQDVIACEFDKQPSETVEDLKIFNNFVETHDYLPVFKKVKSHSEYLNIVPCHSNSTCNSEASQQVLGQSLKLKTESSVDCFFSNFSSIDTNENNAVNFDQIDNFFGSNCVQENDFLFGSEFEQNEFRVELGGLKGFNFDSEYLFHKRNSSELF